MKKKLNVFAFAIVLLLISTMTGCGSTDFQTAVQGEWVLYHYYENAENGVDVFFDDTNCLSINIDEDSFSVTAADDSLDNVGGSIVWTKSDEAEVVMNDGTRCTIRVSRNSKEHNESAEFDVYVVETNMYYVLELPGGES